MQSFEVHSNESACRKSGRLGLEQDFIYFQNNCSQIFQSWQDPKVSWQFKWTLVAITMASFSPLLIFNMILVVTSSCIHQFWQQCRVNHWIWNTRFGVVVQINYISDVVTNRDTNCWPLDSLLLGRYFYWETDVRSPILTTMSS